MKSDYIPTYRIRLEQDGHIRMQNISKPEQILKSIQSLALSDREVLVGLYLNSSNQVIAYHVISMGTINEALVHPREVFKPAIIKKRNFLAPLRPAAPWGGATSPLLELLGAFPPKTSGRMPQAADSSPHP